MSADAAATDKPADAGLDQPQTPGAAQHGMAALTLGAIGVVYGDIGTSPLYTMKEVFAPATGAALDAHNLIGAVSVIFWALMLVVTLKYVVLILRADNRGEGGGLALTALASRAVRERPRLRNTLLLLGVFGATLFYGDSVITPAISVLGAMEGLELIAPASKSYVVPLSLVVLVALFAVQRRGTAFVGRFFGPVIVIWFLALAVSGVVQVAQTPAILAALNPLHAVAFLAERGWQVLATLGAVVLALTGAEALYADMGHFGRRPIQLAWGGLVLPSLALNYMGQGALLMANPAAIDNPFYRMFPDALLVPALLLATLAAVIASQAVISGAYSMTRQAIQLGFLPRMAVRFTSASEAGQIYMPAVNWALLAGVLASVLAFGSSSNLAAAYGMAVTLTMLITTVLTYFVVRNSWGLPVPVAVGATLFFLVLDVLLVAGSAVKLLDGGWFPLALGLLIFALMTTWWHGRAVLLERLREDGLTLQPFIDSLQQHGGEDKRRVDRTAIYPVADATMVPQALLHNLKHYQVLHERNVILHVKFAEAPTVPPARRAQVHSLGNGFWSVTLKFGFMDTPDVPLALEQMQADAGANVGANASAVAGPPLAFTRFESSYFLSRETMVPARGMGLPHWRERAFVAMSRNASGVVEFFRLPDNAVVELGTRVQV